MPQGPAVSSLPWRRKKSSRKGRKVEAGGCWEARGCEVKAKKTPTSRHRDADENWKTSGVRAIPPCLFCVSAPLRLIFLPSRRRVFALLAIVARPWLTDHRSDVSMASITLFEKLVSVVSAFIQLRRIKGKAVRIGRGPATVIGEPTLSGVNASHCPARRDGKVGGAATTREPGSLPGDFNNFTSSTERALKAASSLRSIEKGRNFAHRGRARRWKPAFSNPPARCLASTLFQSSGAFPSVFLELLLSTSTRRGAGEGVQNA